VEDIRDNWLLREVCINHHQQEGHVEELTDKSNAGAFVKNLSLCVVANPCNHDYGNRANDIIERS